MTSARDHSPVGIFPASLESASAASEWLAGRSRELALAPDLDYAVALCLEEAFANSALYGKASAITIGVEVDAESLRLEIIDDGIPFDPTEARREERERGSPRV